jgi:serine/threonine-protein phosphatase 2A catalytic subunit
MTQTYGFYDECTRLYGSCGEDVYGYFADCFDCLPLAAVVNDQVLCVHSGLSPSLDTMDQIQGLNRVGDVPAEGPITDLLWTDPDDRAGWGLVERAESFSFGQDITEEFLTRNALTQMVRSHQLVQEGYNMAHEGRCVTIFSASNFVGRCSNQAAVMELDDSLQCSFKQFNVVSKQKLLCGDSSFDSSRRIPAHFSIR